MQVIDYFEVGRGYYVLAFIEQYEDHHPGEVYAVYYTESRRLIPQETEYSVRVHRNLEEALDEFREQELLYQLYQDEQEEEEARTGKWKCVPMSPTPIKLPAW